MIRARIAYIPVLFIYKRGDRATERVKHAATTMWKGKGWNKAVGLCSSVQGRVAGSPREIKYYNRTHAISPIAGRSAIKCKI